MGRQYLNAELLFGEDEVAALRERTQTAPLARCFASIRQAADDLLGGTNSNPPTQTDLEVLAFTYLLTDDERYAAMARDAMAALLAADQSTWLVADRIQVDIDIRGAGIARGVILAWDWLGDYLDQAERERLLRDLIAKAIVNPSSDFMHADAEGARLLLRVVPRFSKKDSLHPHHTEGSLNNWDAFFAGALGLIGLAAGEDEWVRLARGSIKWYAEDCFGDEGCPAEGLGYMNVGLKVALPLLEALRRRGEDLYPPGLLKSPRWAAWTSSPWSTDHRGFLSFHDCNYTGGTNASTILRLAAQGGDGVARWFHDRRYPGEAFGGSGWDAIFTILYFDPAVEPQAPPTRVRKHDRAMGWVVARDGWEADGRAFVFRAGPAAGWHTHGDNNSFILDAYGERLIVDTGTAPYSHPSHGTWDLESASHNTLIVDGRGQKEWKYYRSADGRQESRYRRLANDDKPILTAGAISHFADREGYCYFVGDATSCYRNTERFHRHVVYFDNGPFLIYDDIASNDFAAFEIRLHTMAETDDDKIVVDGNVARVVRPKAELAATVIAPADVVLETGLGWAAGKENASQHLRIHTGELRRQEAVFATVCDPIPKGGATVSVASRQAGDGLEIELARDAWHARISIRHPQRGSVEAVDVSF